MESLMLTANATNSEALGLGHRPYGNRVIALSSADLPPQVRQLAAREQEIARIVYSTGPTTANAVQAYLSKPLTNGAVRSMLNRLVAKRILVRRLAGAGKTFLYIPALTTDAAIESGFRRFAQDYFGGSTESALRRMNEILRRR
jgi:predicted transcriptional regulator